MRLSSLGSYYLTYVMCCFVKNWIKIPIQTFVSFLIQFVNHYKPPLTVFQEHCSPQTQLICISVRTSGKVTLDSRLFKVALRNLDRQ